MKRILESILKTIGILLGGAVAGTLLLTIAFLIPTSETNKAATYDILEKEGWYPAIPIASASMDTYFHSYLPGVLDNGSDGVMLRWALEPREENALLAAMDMNDYAYYWHGYIAVLRPLLLLFDYGDIRILNSMLQLLVVGLLFLQIYRKKGIKHALVILTSYFLLMAMAMPFSLQFSWVFYIATIGALVLLSGERYKRWDRTVLYRFFLIIGMFTSFFDLLTYPLYTWAFPLILFLVMQEDEKKPLEYVKQVVFTGLWWIVGYGGFWVLKWALGGLILQRNIFEDAFSEVGLHLGAKEDSGFGIGERLDVLYANWKHYENKIYMLLFAVWLLFAFWGTMRDGVRKSNKGPAMALIGSSGVVWYFALANHTAVHHFFTYRIWGITILTVLAILVECTATTSAKEVVADGVCGVKLWKQKMNWKMLGIWAVCAVLACGTTLLAKEDVYVHNADRESRLVTVAEGDELTARFTPNFGIVEKIGICAKSASGTGNCILQLKDGEKVLYREEIPLNSYNEKTYSEITGNWKLKKGRTYQMSLTVQGTQGETAFLVTDNTENPLNECSEAQLNGEAVGGLPMVGVFYRGLPVSKQTLLFLVISWCGVWFAAYSALAMNVVERLKETRKQRRK